MPRFRPSTSQRNSEASHNSRIARISFERSKKKSYWSCSVHPSSVHGRCDLVFIDGDHSEAGCERDWSGWSGFVAVGGRVVFHDARAGEPGAVTVATNMAGRGADIALRLKAKAEAIRAEAIARLM